MLHYQPLIDLTSAGMIGVEALIRWPEPNGGLVPPGDFIPLAEENGTILALGRWVLYEACRQVAEWTETRRTQPITLTVNLAAAQLREPGFMDDLDGILGVTKLAPSQLVLEMTETAMFHDTATTIARLQDLRARGIRIAIDDFGTGYSSLGYLRRFPVDILKIAREFVDDDSAEWAFPAAIIALGRTLNLRIVAEGIEEEWQLERLRTLGCELGQGFYFARPTDAAGFELYVAARHPGKASGARRGLVTPGRLIEPAH